MTTKKAVNGALGKYSKKAAAQPEETLNPERVRRGTGEMVTISVRLSKANWMTLRNLAMTKGETLQSLAVNGFNQQLRAEGLDALE